MTDTPSLLWFHAFDRTAVEGIVDVLVSGPRPNTDPATPTRRNEITIGIDPPCVYAYLGRTTDAFGKRAIAVRLDALDGNVSPFDTGGLIQHIYPVCEQTNSQKQDYLQSHTWSSLELPSLLTQYPGQALVDYLAGQRPGHDGPHLYLDVSGPVENIWSDTRNNWQSWTWEGRSDRCLHAGEQLVGWTCHPDEYSVLMTEVLCRYTDDEAETLGIDKLPVKYHRGGVSELVSGLRHLQEASHA